MIRGASSCQPGRPTLSSASARRGLVARLHQPPGRAVDWSVRSRRVPSYASRVRKAASPLARRAGALARPAMRSTAASQSSRLAVGISAGRHADLAQHRRGGRAGTREGGQCGDLAEADVAVILVADAAVEDGLQPFDHADAGAFGDRQSRFGREREDVAGERLRAVERAARPVAEQAVLGLVGRDFAGQPRPSRRVAERDDARSLLLEALVRVGAHVRGHAGKRGRERVGERNVHRAAARQRAGRARDRDRRVADAGERRGPGLDGDRGHDVLRRGDPIGGAAVGRAGRDLPAQATAGLRARSGSRRSARRRPPGW